MPRSPSLSFVLLLGCSGCGGDLSRLVVELPPAGAAATVVLGISERSGEPRTHALVFARAERPVQLDHRWDPTSDEVLTAYAYAGTIARLGLVEGELEPPPAGEIARALPPPDLGGRELVLDRAVAAGDRAPSWQPLTLDMLARFVFFVPPLDCDAGLHDGGARRCVPRDRCDAGFHDGGDGTCTLEDTCAHAHYLGRDGACLPVCHARFPVITGSGACCSTFASGDPCVDPCGPGQVRDPSTNACVPDSWCCTATACAPC